LTFNAMNMPIRTLSATVTIACVLGSVPSATADRFIRQFGRGISAQDFCSAAGNAIGPGELFAANANGDVLLLGAGTPNGTARGWGSNRSGVYAWPPSGMAPEQCKEFAVDAANPPFFHTQISLGNGHAAAICDAVLLTGGYWARTVICWGANDEGQCDVAYEPWGTPLHQVMQVSCGAKHTLARQSNGHVRAWGSNSYGQCTVPTAIYTGFNVDVVDVAAGGLHSIARHSDGRLTCWGAGAATDPVDNNWRCGQANPPANLGPVTAVAAGGVHSVALRPNGTVVCWGAGSMEETFNWNSRQSIVPADLGPCLRIAASMYATAALAVDGSVRVWGLTQEGGQCAGQCDIQSGLGNISGLNSTFLGTIVITDQPRPQCPADLARSCNVDGADLGALLAAWGSNAATEADLNDDGAVDGVDLGMLLAAWGSCPD
jgi:hypothetical protein